MNKKVYIIFLILVIIGVFFLIKTRNTPTLTLEKTTKTAAMPENTPEKPQPNTVRAQPNSGHYIDYSPTALSQAFADNNRVVLFFYAPWCPYCRAADKAFSENTNKIPAGVTLLKTDYDNNTELKQKYGVTYQHTFVQIDNSGNLITKWVSGDIDLLIKNLK